MGTSQPPAYRKTYIGMRTECKREIGLESRPARQGYYGVTFFKDGINYSLPLRRASFITMLAPP
jgi:hypothetical protein